MKSIRGGQLVFNSGLVGAQCAVQDGEGRVEQGNLARGDLAQPVGQACGLCLTIEQVLVDGVDLGRRVFAIDGLGLSRGVESLDDVSLLEGCEVGPAGCIGRTTEVCQVSLVQVGCANGHVLLL